MAKVVVKSKPKAPPPDKPGKGVALREKPALPANLEDMMERDAGKGVSSKPEDNLVPMMTIIQDKTPVADKHNKAHQEGVEGGMIWLKNSAHEFVPGEEGVVVQHCHSYKALVEWRSERKGFVAQHPHSEDFASVIPDVKQVQIPGKQEKFMWVRKNGNQIVDTRYEIVRVFLDDGGRLQYVIPFTSSGHTVARGWNTLRSSFHLKNGSVAPSFSRLYHLTTRTKTNSEGTWFLFDVKDRGWVAELEEYEAGLALYNAFNKGEKEIDTRTLDPAEDEDDGKL